MVLQLASLVNEKEGRTVHHRLHGLLRQMRSSFRLANLLGARLHDR
jgi:hypothetical protein